MKVLVLGATGGTGRLIVRDALAKGHSVVALVRSKANLGSATVNCTGIAATERADGGSAYAIYTRGGAKCGAGHARTYGVAAGEGSRE
jgi:uncharacterized protein YbjT (DUF2867 family)